LENREKPVHQRNSPGDDPKSHQLDSQNVDYRSSTSEKFTEFQKDSILFFLARVMIVVDFLPSPADTPLRGGSPGPRHEKTRHSLSVDF
jgi:hypothetical protein